MMMKHLSRLILFALVLIPAVTLSQSNSPQSPVEISGEPRHHPKFENEFVRIWDVTVPAGDATLWHTHRNDNVVVTLIGAKLRLEKVGAPTADVEWKTGDVNFGKASYTHRAMNVGTTPFHNFTIELLKSPSGPKILSALNEPTGRQPILENERMRVYRLSLAPGESTSMHPHLLPGLGITITPGTIQVTTAGTDKPDRIKVTAGEVRWRSGPINHSIKNVGKKRFEAIDIELKFRSIYPQTSFVPRAHL
jgi:quercetin dioxygenase-like cupin family protein